MELANGHQAYESGLVIQPGGSMSSFAGNMYDAGVNTAGRFLQVEREGELDAPHYRTWEPSVFVQDSWRGRWSLTFDLGLRYDYFSYPRRLACAA
jgi:outer membrane receptor protein involved in Fe transport